MKYISCVIATLLSFGRCSQICVINSVSFYSDSACTRASSDTWLSDFLTTSNSIIDNGATCQVIQKAAKWTNQMARITCLTTSTIKYEQFNLNNEDPTCAYPYATSADLPSFVAASDECVLLDNERYSSRYLGTQYIKLDIGASRTRGDDADASEWTLTDTTQAANQAELENQEWQNDNALVADSCQVTDIVLYSDSSCRTVSDQDEATKTASISTINTAIKENACSLDGDVLKKRVYCESSSRYVTKYYSYLNEDPNCLRAYPSDALTYAPLTFDNGECVPWDNTGNTYTKVTIVENRESPFFNEDIAGRLSLGITSILLLLAHSTL